MQIHAWLKKIKQPLLKSAVQSKLSVADITSTYQVILHDISPALHSRLAPFVATATVSVQSFV
jgi:hypothetical protein